MIYPDMKIDPVLKKACPDACLGILTYQVEVVPKNKELWEYYKIIENLLKQKLQITELALMPQIGESRAGYKALGANPGKNRVSSEALYRRIRQGKELYQINSLVDVNNLVSLMTGYSFGSYDLAKIDHDILFRCGQKEESYAGIGKAVIPLEHIPLLADSQGPFGSPTSDSTRAMIQLSTTNAMTVIYAFSGKESCLAALDLAKEYFTRFAHVNDIEYGIISI